MLAAKTTPIRTPKGRPALGRLAAWACCWALVAAGFSGCSACSTVRNAVGVAYYRQGQHQVAAQQFHAAMAADPRNPDSYYNLGATYHRLGKATGNREYQARAEEYYNECLNRDDGQSHRECYRGLATLLLDQGRDDAAERLLEGWTDRNPTSADARVELARLHHELGDPQAERDALLEAVALDPHDSRAHAALGQLHEQAGETGQALANYERSLARNPLRRDIAGRVASLRAAGSGAPWSATPSATRLADRLPRPPRLN